MSIMMLLWISVVWMCIFGCISEHDSWHLNRWSMAEFTGFWGWRYELTVAVTPSHSGSFSAVIWIAFLEEWPFWVHWVGWFRDVARRHSKQGSLCWWENPTGVVSQKSRLMKDYIIYKNSANVEQWQTRVCGWWFIFLGRSLRVWTFSEEFLGEPNNRRTGEPPSPDCPPLESHQLQ